MLRNKIALAVSLCLTASLVLAGAVVAGDGDRNDDRIPDRWEKRHNLSLKVKQHRRDQDGDGLENRGEWRAKLDPRDDDTDGDGVDDGDENAGTIASFEDGDLTIDLAGGGSLTAAVTDRTDVECEDDDDKGGDARAAHGGKRHGDDDCGDDALVAGATVLEAELKVRDGRAVWKELELLEP